jgi:hypothetical protein
VPLSHAALFLIAWLKIVGFDVVTKLACRCTSGLVVPMAILSPLRLNIRTSFIWSPIVAMRCGATLRYFASRSTTAPLLG